MSQQQAMQKIVVEGKNGRVGQIEHGLEDNGWYVVAPNGHGTPSIVGWYREKPSDEWFAEMIASIRETAALYGR